MLCLTATAKPDVVEDIARHFRDRLGIELTVFDGGAERTNLTFEVIPTSGGEKFAHIHQILMSNLPPDTPGGAIVYCATRNQSEEIAEYLQLKEMAADHFHAGLPPETKKNVQRRFIGGELRAIAATNAFGMGIDKPDVRLVIHADIRARWRTIFRRQVEPDGTAKRRVACCCTRRTTWSVSSACRPGRGSPGKRFTASSGRCATWTGKSVSMATWWRPREKSSAKREKVFERDSATDDTRVRTAVAWLEEAELLKREENFVQIFPSSLRVTRPRRPENVLPAQRSRTLTGGNCSASPRR